MGRSRRPRSGTREKKIICSYLDHDAASLEAGTGSGRIILTMARLGYTNLFGYEFVIDLLRTAQQRPDGKVKMLSVRNGTELAVRGDAFAQPVYLQQFICFMPGEAGRRRGLDEARALASGGTAVCSFLNLADRYRHPGIRCYLAYLKALRLVRRAAANAGELPWFVMAGKLNWIGLLCDRGPFVHWFSLSLRRRSRAMGAWSGAVRARPIAATMTSITRLLVVAAGGHGYRHQCARNVRTPSRTNIRSASDMPDPLGSVSPCSNSHSELPLARCSASAKTG